MFVVRPERIADERGFFARTFGVEEFARQGIDFRVNQSSISSNRRRGTLRGMHFQAAPHEEQKLVSCIRGSIHDVVVDLRPNSARYKRWTAVELSAENALAVLIPAGCAHGFITLDDDSVVRYEISVPYAPASSRGVRFDDPAFAIRWPIVPAVMSSRDLSFPPFQD
jgi:dTDP-4-dehydrorhamnose 3,5-epimerase